jgi:hypothetical protein
MGHPGNGAAGFPLQVSVSGASLSASMETEGAVGRGDGGNGMLVKQKVAVAFNQHTEAVERLDITFQFIPRHHHDDYTNTLFASLVEVLILDIEWGLGHGHSFSGAL